MQRLRFPATYRRLLASRQMRLLLAGLGVSSLGDGISTVTIAWLAVRTAPAGYLGLFVGLAVAADTLPGIIGALRFALSRRQQDSRWDRAGDRAPAGQVAHRRPESPSARGSPDRIPGGRPPRL
jgi:hypothetical protein